MARKNNIMNSKVEWEYSPALEKTTHINLKKKYGLFIDGKFVKPLSGKYFTTYNPATEDKLAEIAYADARDVDKAVKAARRAYNVWSKITPLERSKYIFRIIILSQQIIPLFNVFIKIF